MDLFSLLFKAGAAALNLKSQRQIYYLKENQIVPLYREVVVKNALSSGNLTTKLEELKHYYYENHVHYLSYLDFQCIKISFI